MTMQWHQRYNDKTPKKLASLKCYGQDTCSVAHMSLKVCSKRVIFFTQTDRFKDIELNTEKRKLAKTNFEKD